MKYYARRTNVALVVALMLLLASLILIMNRQTAAVQKFDSPIDATKSADLANRRATEVHQTPITEPGVPLRPPTSNLPTGTPDYPDSTKVGDGVIITYPQPMPGSSYRFTTMWRLSLSQEVYVYAGSMGFVGDAANQGVIVTIDKNPDTGERWKKEYPLSPSSGSATIVGVVGTVAQISTSAGGSYSFDMATRSLTSSAPMPTP